MMMKESRLNLLDSHAHSSRPLYSLLRHSSGQPVHKRLLRYAMHSDHSFSEKRPPSVLRDIVKGASYSPSGGGFHAEDLSIFEESILVT